MKHYLIVLTISILPFIGMFLTPDMPHTHDGPVHLARIAAYYKELSYGQIPPRWASELNYGYGMPLFNFMYHLPYLIASIPVMFSLGLVTAFKLTLLVSFLASGVGMFIFARKFFGDVHKAYLVTLLYQFAPFHLVELVVRGSIGEAYTYSFLPFVLLGILLVFEKPSSARIVVTSLITALLILSHNAISLVSFAVAILFVLWFAPDLKRRLMGLVALTIGLGLTAFYWLPAVLERKYTYGDLFMRTMYQSHFPPLLHFVIPNFTNATNLQTGGITVYLGLIQTVAVLATLYVLISRTIHDSKKRSVARFSLFLIGTSFFFMQPISAWIWEKIPTLRMFQFPWRFLAVTGMGTAFLGSVLVPLKKQRQSIVVTLVSAIAVLTTIVYWQPPLGYDKIVESDYWNFPLNTTFFGETDLIWSEGPAKSYPHAPFELIDGKGQISEPYKKSIRHSFTINAQTPVRILDHTQYFPGWRVYIDGVKTPIEFQDQNHRGRITFNVSEGVHKVVVIFGSSPVRTVGNSISLITLFVVTLFSLVP